MRMTDDVWSAPEGPSGPPRSRTSAVLTGVGLVAAALATALFVQRFMVVGPMMMDGREFFEAPMSRPPAWSVAAFAAIAMVAFALSARRTRRIVLPAIVGTIWVLMAAMAVWMHIVFSRFRSLVLIAFAACGIVTAAEAQEVRLSVPALLGASSFDDGRFVYGVRPEILLVWDPSIGGLGAFGEIGSADKHLFGGGGLTYAYSLGWLGLAPSLGLYHRADRESGVMAGMFVGFRREAGVFDVPYGVRVDAQIGFDGATNVVLLAQLDLVPVGFFIYQIIETMR